MLVSEYGIAFFGCSWKMPNPISALCVYALVEANLATETSDRILKHMLFVYFIPGTYPHVLHSTLPNVLMGVRVYHLISLTFGVSGTFVILGYHDTPLSG